MNDLKSMKNKNQQQCNLPDTVVVRDYDPGDQGRLEVVSDEDTFKVEEADGTIKLSVAR